LLFAQIDIFEILYKTVFAQKYIYPRVTISFFSHFKSAAIQPQKSNNLENYARLTANIG